VLNRPETKTAAFRVHAGLGSRDFSFYPTVGLVKQQMRPVIEIRTKERSRPSASAPTFILDSRTQVDLPDRLCI